MHSKQFGYTEHKASTVCTCTYNLTPEIRTW